MLIDVAAPTETCPALPISPALVLEVLDLPTEGGLSFSNRSR